MDMYTLLYIKQIAKKDLLQSTGDSAQCYVAAWRGGEFGGEWTHVYVWPNPFTVHQNYHNIVNLCRVCVCSVASVVSDSLRHYGLQPARLLCPWDSPGKNTRVGCHALLQGIFPTQGLNPHLCLLHCRWILYLLSHLGSPQSSEPSSKDTSFMETYLILFFAVLPALHVS